MKRDGKQRRKEHLRLKAEEEACIAEDARMEAEEEERAGLMAEEETCIAEEMRLKAEEEDQARLKSSSIIPHQQSRLHFVISPHQQSRLDYI